MELGAVLQAASWSTILSLSSTNVLLEDLDETFDAKSPIEISTQKTTISINSEGVILKFQIT